MERVKAMHRNAAAAEAEAYRPELLADEEPRYLRRQKPVEIRRKKFGSRSWPFYRRVAFWTLAAAAVIAAAVFGARFLLYSPKMLLLKPEQIALNGSRIVSRQAILQQFVGDRNRSVLQIPLDERRSAIEEIPWVESASVQRILPNRVRVDITERTPIAFVRNGAELALIDAHGVILDRPDGQDYTFPIVTGLADNMPREERAKRMATFSEFMGDIELVRPASSQAVSEVDLSNARDLRVVMTGLPRPSDTQAVTIHFGQSEFTSKFKRVVDNFAQWQAENGRLSSIDLQFARQVVVNPESSASAQNSK